jgi:hypothetical protein
MKSRVYNLKVQCNRSDATESTILREWNSGIDQNRVSAFYTILEDPLIVGILVTLY